jgi:hypothetical protein
MRFCVDAGLLQVVERQGVSLLKASSAQRLVPTRVRQACWGWCQLMSACNGQRWRETHEARRDALLGGDHVKDGKACEKELECHCEQCVVVGEWCLGARGGNE